MIFSLIHRYQFRKLKKQGLQISDDCRILGMPNFGSEPYLISIGKHVAIASKVTFITHDGATWVFRKLPRYNDVIKYGRITIHDNCFIGYGSIIMPGVSIGPNSVVAAGSLVNKDVPPNSIVVGTPAKVLHSIEDYAEKCLALTPNYDKEKYKIDKKSELLSLYPYPW